MKLLVICTRHDFHCPMQQNFVPLCSSHEGEAMTPLFLFSMGENIADISKIYLPCIPESRYCRKNSLQQFTGMHHKNHLKKILPSSSVGEVMLPGCSSGKNYLPCRKVDVLVDFMCLGYAI